MKYMMTRPLHLTANQLVMAALLGVLALLGGASRFDEPVQIVIRFAALAALAFAIFGRSAAFDTATRPAAIALGLSCLAIAIQLIPLPFSIWSALPGRTLYAQQGHLLGVDGLWRPLSLSPDRTWSALLSMIVPISIVALMTKLDRRARHSLLTMLVYIVCFSAIVALFRMATNFEWIAFRYTADGGGSGIFANRNHEALLLAMGFPLLATWIAEDRFSRLNQQLRWMIGTTAGILLVVIIPVTGSRAGLVLGAVGILMAAGILWAPLRRALRRVRRRQARKLIAGAIIAVIACLLVLGVMLSGAEGVRRLVTMDVGADLRARLFPRVVEMITTYFPAGSGFATFDPVFRRFERLDDLQQVYFNQAHNDLLQIVLEGGAIGGLMLLAGIAWLATVTIRAWRAGSGHITGRMARLASMLIILMITASFVDYPLRTPLMLGLFVILVVWLHEPIPAAEAESRARPAAAPQAFTGSALRSISAEIGSATRNI